MFANLASVHYWKMQFCGFYYVWDLINYVTSDISDLPDFAPILLVNLLELYLMCLSGVLQPRPPLIELIFKS